MPSDGAPPHPPPANVEIPTIEDQDAVSERLQASTARRSLHCTACLHCRQAGRACREPPGMSLAPVNRVIILATPSIKRSFDPNLPFDWWLESVRRSFGCRFARQAGLSCTMTFLPRHLASLNTSMQSIRRSRWSAGDQGAHVISIEWLRGPTASPLPSYRHDTGMASLS